MPSPEYRELPPSWGGYERQLRRGIDLRPKSWLYRTDLWVTDVSFFGNWLRAKAGTLLTDPHLERHRVAFAWEEELRQRPSYESLFQDPSHEDDFTAFALQQFKERAERDNVVLLILAAESMGSRGHRAFDRLNAIVETQGIPVINMYDYIIRQGRRFKDAHWEHDSHWNANGHQWAAEALLEYLRQHPEVCTR